MDWMLAAVVALLLLGSLVSAHGSFDDRGRQLRKEDDPTKHHKRATRLLTAKLRAERLARESKAPR